MIRFGLPSHYDIFDCEYGYSFKTDSGNTYFITFIKYPTISEFLSVDVYMMNIDRADDSNHRNGSDNKVRNTILLLVVNFWTHRKSPYLSRKTRAMYSSEDLERTFHFF